MELKDPTHVATAPLVATGLLGGFITARETGIRPLGGVVLLGLGAYAARTWQAKQGTPTAAALGALYLAGFGASHPLAKKIGAWPSVLAVTAINAAAAYAASDSR